MKSSPPPIVLASTSRYRRALLARLGVRFTEAAPNADETPHAGEAPEATVLRLAEAKARAVTGRRRKGLVIGADQVAACDGVVIGKPRDHAEAVAQLTRQSGRTTVFHTGVALYNVATGRLQRALVDVASTFRRLTPQEIEAYLRRERPYDCAGSVKAEGLGIALFERIESDDPTALIGLPLITVVRMLSVEGYPVLAGVAPS
jgi:septum formation protein